MTYEDDNDEVYKDSFQQEEDKKAYVVKVIYKKTTIRKKQILHIADECFSVFYASDRQSIMLRFYDPNYASAFAQIMNHYSK
jgi:hypothetical protein